ncbi:hypothetical protein [Lysinibacillus sphaericus]|uniref:Uncharacterized protein n=1 Tax=Lysinibacillus sphaericus OT4b.31 TaxID=1285586 RepID=R7ZDW3_LYSSH|nr:hypothetical protein [Lysinibacillus sphaericus]EON72335.1 hypothetical protein H131_12208 [Lysinibacillus sphaericus OT4b.31]
MFMTLGILIIAAIIAYFVIPPLKKKHETKTIVVFSIFLVLGTALNIALSLNVSIPSPADLISFIFKPIRELIITLFQ